MIENKTQYGFNPDVPDDRDFVFGGSNVPKKVLQPSSQWNPPFFERQRRAGFETSACISYGVLNVLEMMHHVKFGYEPNYSDRFLSKNSGTTRNGNTPRKVYSALRKLGTVKEEEYNFNALNWEEYYKEIPEKLLSKGKEWASMHSFSYARVGTSPDEMKEALKYSPLGIGIFAWAYSGKGYYYQPDDARPNHFCVLIGYKEDEYWLVFDTYEESVKKLVWSYPFSYVCSYTLDKKKTYPSLRQNLLRDFFKLFSFKRA